MNNHLNIKVAFVVRNTLETIKGGDTIQVLKTAAYLREIGVNVEIYKSSEKIDYKNYDLLHLFNSIRPADHLLHIQKCQIPFVISPIFLNYRTFDLSQRTGLQKVAFKILGTNGTEYAKNIYRFAKKQDKLASKSYLLGHKRALKKVLFQSALWLPNSESEYQRLAQEFKRQHPYTVIPNGIDSKLFGQVPKDVIRKRAVMCAAQIYGRKNQKMLIEVCKELEVPLYIVGNPPPNHKKYLIECKAMAGKDTYFYSFVPQEELLKMYASVKVHALPSWFETTGLSSLEAGAMGCSLVVGTAGDTKEYFQNIAHFCHPADKESIKNAVANALNEPYNPDIRKTILEKYTWQIAAEKTLKAYKQVLNL